MSNGPDSKLGTIITAMVTPFSDHGSVDLDSTRTLLNHLVANGSDGVVVAGTTGEAPTLSMEEHKRVIELCIEAAARRERTSFNHSV